MKTFTLKVGDRLRLGDASRWMEVAAIDPLGRWVKLQAQAPEHVRVENRSGRQPEPVTTR